MGRCDDGVMLARFFIPSMSRVSGLNIPSAWQSNEKSRVALTIRYSGFKWVGLWIRYSGFDFAKYPITMVRRSHCKCQRSTCSLKGKRVDRVDNAAVTAVNLSVR
ncbi:hypothetical protein PoB_005629900 [Plakobranchus ocellatus]|uniref:Uncharacterized protein n=1 Tax=Plakobranchus ocellatus TaxID=259542 RepID=A0AAV4CB39_9GAST|nr:hypothetical protein PoB_005629900 [Plakobranchus ocellatus]